MKKQIIHRYFPAFFAPPRFRVRFLGIISLLIILAFPIAAQDDVSKTAPSASAAPSAPAAKSVEEQRLEILRFGTETEIAKLIQTVKDEKVEYLDKELIEVANNTKNRSILAGIFSFFGETKKKGLEERALRAIRERDDEANETVLSAVDYLGWIGAEEAAETLTDLINSGENRFLNSSIRALGRAVSGQKPGSPDEPRAPSGKSGDTALFLLDYYKNRSPSDENRREIILALGETGSKEPVEFLSDLVKNPDERMVLKMAALESLSKIGDDRGVDAVIEAVSSSDPNVRASAITALGRFSGEAADNAILEGFRDSYYRTRIGAAQAAGKRKLESAIPFLRFRAERDDVPTVKDEALKALGAINNSEAVSILETFFLERKNADRVRLVAADMLVKNHADTYSSKIIIEMEEAKDKRMTPLYNGFIRLLSTAKSGNFEDFARRLMSGGGVIEKSLALDLVLNNEFRGLAGEVRSLLDEKKHSAVISRKAKSTLEKLGLASEENQEETNKAAQ